MGEIEDENFPRGGTRPRFSGKRQKEDDNLFSHTKQAKNKKQRKERVIPETISDETFHSSLNIQGTLTYNSLKTDMIILGCIRHITNFSLEVELPGLTIAYVNITNISDPFTKHLNSKLEESDEDSDILLKQMFKIGQFVLTKVINIESKEKGIHVECTINPRDIYSDKSHNSFENWMLIWCSVQAELEHGYEINVGIKNCRVFLPSENVDGDRKLFVGELLWGTIHKCDSSNVASTLRIISSKSEHLKNTKIKEMNNLYDLIPGMQIEVMVDKITNTGIQCKFLNDLFGYIDEGHLLEDLSKYHEGNLLTAYILYIDHAVKVTHFTTFELDLAQLPEYKIGTTVTAEVISKARNGIYLKLPSKARCIVTNRRLVNSWPKKFANMDISETIRLKFAPKTRHNCRILDYNHMSRTYIGTVEPSLIKEAIFTAEDVVLGQLLHVVIDKVKAEGLVVSAGHIKGFIPNLYLSNIKYSDAIKKKFKEDQKIKARVLSVQDGNVLLTLKSSQVDSEECLTKLEQAKRGDRFPGVIISTKPTGAFVVFYGNVNGWISKQYLDEQDDDQKPDPQQFFFRGQVVNPWVLGVINDKVILSLRQPIDYETFGALAVGQKINGVVSDIQKDKIFVKTSRGKPVGIVPVNHLSSNLSLCPIVLKTFKIGDQLEDLLCINNSSTPRLLSIRESLALKRCPELKLLKFKKLRPGILVRCSYLSACELGIYVLPLILDYTDKILIRRKDITKKGKALPTFEPLQSIVTKIVKIDHETKKIRLTAQLTEVFDNSVEGVLKLFSEYLTDVQRVKEFGEQNDWDICKYNPGDRLICRVEKLGYQGGCLVKLPSGACGVVAPRLCPGNLKEGQNITGVFLSQNFTNNYTDICFKSDISQKINQYQDGLISCPNLSSCIVENILLKTDLVIALLKQKDGNRQLVYIPLFLHENDFEGCSRYYQQEKFKISICGKVDKRLVGMSKKLFVTLDKTKEKISTIKAIRTEKKIKESEKRTSRNKEEIKMEVEEAAQDSEDEEMSEEIKIEMKEEAEDLDDEEKPEISHEEMSEEIKIEMKEEAEDLDDEEKPEISHEEMSEEIKIEMKEEAEDLDDEEKPEISHEEMSEEIKIEMKEEAEDLDDEEKPEISHEEMSEEIKIEMKEEAEDLDDEEKPEISHEEMSEEIKIEMKEEAEDLDDEEKPEISHEEMSEEIKIEMKEEAEDLDDEEKPEISHEEVDEDSEDDEVKPEISDEEMDENSEDDEVKPEISDEEMDENSEDDEVKPEISDEEMDENSEHNESSKDDEEEKPSENNETSKDEEIEEVQVKKQINGVSSNNSAKGPVLSGVSSFFNTKTNVEPEVSSDDEVEETTVKKKKKLSAAERAQQAKEELARISKIENELADSTRTPEISHEEMDENSEDNESSKDDEEEKPSENNETSEDEEIEEVQVKKQINGVSSNNSAKRPVLSGVSSFFNTKTNVEPEVSSDDEVEETMVKKKKKLSAAERAQQAKEEEARISKIENELADSTRTPESAEQFDRLLLANPNSSELWTKYIAFHTAATEFDKARVVARRALEAINMTLLDERFNIWIALLNLENMFGTKESFDKTFEEAVKYNDSLQIYLKVIKMLAETGKLADMEEKIKKVRNKYKQVPEMWLEIAYTYYQVNEFKEARNMTLLDERFNVWIALLNIENMLGTKESFDKTFEEAVKYNDSLQIYLKVIKMLAETGKLADMEEKIKKVRNKHKQVPEMWLEIAKTYYQLNKFKEARNMKDSALKSIDNRKTQLEIIVKFAIMEFKFGDANHGAAIFETILSSYPRIVTIWTTYVDQLVKKDNIDQARQVLERSVCQRLPLKNMKTLFMKFRMFEEQHGTPETVEAVKEKAKEYVARVSSN
ncbi:unnamed protein product [Psylliodes chrysocephalus]|uniref:S1 motif domain-containing protein n=1 Tax=Psylliodes chrysocephalus TaxID=3402493 RepID=A0A9P0GGY7_9CUCU|nr:unnamed protein product [Psylliodes chrysocephala]